MSTDKSQRPARVIREPAPVGVKRKFKDVLGMLSAKHVEGWRNNPNIRDCCKQFDENEIELFDTDGNGKPDLLVMTCSDCGRKQRVGALGGEGRNAVV